MAYTSKTEAYMMKGASKSKRRKKKRAKHGMPSAKTSLTPHKARVMLHEGDFESERQRRFIGAVASKGKRGK